MLIRYLRPASIQLLLFALWAGHSYVVAQDSREKIAWFEKNIRPLLISKCYSCHSEKKGKAEGGLTLDTKQGWEKGGDQGPTIVPGDIDASLLIRAIRYQESDLEMPPDRKLSDNEIKLLEEWVKLGAPDPRTKKTNETTTTNPADPVAGRSHWAFQPLRIPQPSPASQTRHSSWERSPIDFFVSQKLREYKLSPNQDADRRNLVRRTYVLLVGILPSPAQVNSFVEDLRPDAFERLVDQLLSSPQFGERWGRHWLDLARYADSNGLDENFLFREAWRYRNWVINATNSDQSLDRFSLEQIAGDLLPYHSIEQRDRQRIAAGFLVIGPKVLLGINNELQKMDVADELVDTVGRTFLGQTLGCARCHDHKFDPIPTTDYYALAGIFTSTEVMQTRYMLGQQRKMERLFGIGSDENKKNLSYEKYWRERAQLKKRLDQSRKALELLKKSETKLVDVIKRFPNAIAEKLKKAASDDQNRKNDGKQNQNSAAAKILPKERERQQQQFVDELNKRYTSPPPIPPRAMIPTDKSAPHDESVRIAGQFDRKGEVVPRGFLTVLSSEKPMIANTQSGRVELAKWLFDLKDGAGNLTARVLANRVWQHLIGQGLVQTSDQFGRTGHPPSHPELLDYLARELTSSEWSMKHLIRKICLSSTFRQSSQHSTNAQKIDPENRLLWRAHRRRLSPEAFRDSMLFAAKELDLRPLDSSVSYLGDQATAVGANKNRRRTDFKNRSVYLPVIRNDLPEIFESFDFTDPHRTTGTRPQTTAAKNGLYVLNDQQMMSTSTSLARQALNRAGISDQERIRWIFNQVLNDSPTESESNQMLGLIRTVKKLETAKNASDPSNKKQPENNRENLEIKAWGTVCHALFASSRFQILE